VDHERLGVADVRQQRGEFGVFHGGFGGLEAAVESERHHAAVSSLEVLAGGFVGLVVSQAGVVHPRHVRVRLERFRDDLGVLTVALHPQRERLRLLERVPGVERRLLVAEVAHPAGDGREGERLVAERLDEVDAVVRGVVRRDLRELLGVLAPRERAAVDEDAADGGSVAGEPLGRRLPDEICAVVDRPAERGRRERVVDEHGRAVFVSDLGDPLDVGGDERRVTDRLEVDVGGVFVYRLGVPLVVERVDESGRDATALDGVCEVGVRPAVQRRRGDNVVAGGRQHERREIQRCHSGGGGDRAHAVFEGGHPFF
jgi:hypothetical protein